MGDWDFTDEELARLDRDREEFERENPNHPAVIRGRNYREGHPELFPPLRKPESPTHSISQTASGEQRAAYVQWMAAVRRSINTYQVDNTMLERFAVRARRLMQGMRKRFGRDPEAVDFLRAFRDELGLDETRDPDDGTLIDHT